MVVNRAIFLFHALVGLTVTPWLFHSIGHPYYAIASLAFGVAWEIRAWRILRDKRLV